MSNETPHNAVFQQLQFIAKISLYLRTGIGRLNSPTIANAMERMMRKVRALIVKICIIGSLICPSRTTVFSRLAVSVTVEYRILKGGRAAQVEVIFKKVAKVRKNLKFE